MFSSIDSRDIVPIVEHRKSTCPGQKITATEKREFEMTRGDRPVYIISVVGVRFIYTSSRVIYTVVVTAVFTARFDSLNGSS